MADCLASPGSCSPTKTCALCTTPFRYKCPRCAFPTCSVACSRKHKQETGCTGERDKVKYVPMNTYDWGTMMRDYCYLEDVGRKVSEWGSEIVRGGYMENNRPSKRAHLRKSPSRKRTAAVKSKREALRAHLDVLGIDVELLPAGMDRRALNQSAFDQKSKCCLLTVEFIFYPPTTLASVSSSSPPPYKILGHRNSLSATLLMTLRRHASSTISKSQKQKEHTPDWVLPMVTLHPEAPECFIPPDCYIRARTELPQVLDAVHYHQVEPTLNLGELLQGTCFVEFPTIHVFDPDASSFRGIVIDKSGSIIRVSGDDQIDVKRVAKRRKLNEETGRKTVFTLIGGYGSENSHSEDEAKATELATLEAYQDDDDDEAQADAVVEEIQSSSSDNDTPSERDQLDSARLTEIMRQEQCMADEDILDWGDEWEVDVEC